MFSAAFKNSLTERRHAVRVAAGVEQMELAEGREAYASLAGGYRSKMEAELQEICSNALQLSLGCKIYCTFFFWMGSTLNQSESAYDL